MIFSKIKEAFASSFNSIFNKNTDMIVILDELEEMLILADVGTSISISLCDNLRKQFKGKTEVLKQDVISALKQELLVILNKQQYQQSEEREAILVVGVNGVGKTTSIAKLTNRYISKGKRALVVAADTFRAGAIEQLQVWAERLNIECVAGNYMTDPSSVAFDGMKKFNNEQYDCVIIDTAGRLQTKKNLMDEMQKIKRSIEKNIYDNTVLKVLMVVDATSGQNVVEQVKAFNEAISVDGIILTKLDSTAKGGIVFRLVDELNIPIAYIGTGETLKDLASFNAEDFVNNII